LRILFFSFLYRFVRFTTTKILYFFQWLLLKPKDLEPAVNFGDRNLALISQIVPIIFKYRIPKNIGVEIYDLKFPSPIIGASFKSETKILSTWLDLGLGSVTMKTIMEKERCGNERPRLQEYIMNGKRSILNSMGLPGPGINNFANKIKSSVLWDYNRPIGISIGGDSESEYISNIQKLLPYLIGKENYFLELNISCPNTENGKTIADDPNKLDTILQKIRHMTSNVISIKVSPDSKLNLLLAIGEIAKGHSQILINAGNTQYKTIIETGLNKRSFSMSGGGLSGPELFPRMLEIVKNLTNSGVPVIATGGISTIDHVKAVKSQGAILFGMATALIMDPFCVPRINRIL